ncbi:Inositol polyphosphate 1-phosphatase [Mactra antiquata]
MKVHEILKALINVSEKGANIARIIRSEASLLDLLVQEKKGDQKNERFVRDFKTLADVLVQEVVRYDLKQQFSGIGESIYGEESNKFTNTLGDSITVEIQDTSQQTQQILSEVLDENMEAAKILADVIHQDVNVDNDLQCIDKEINVKDIGVWIDPIDSTAQYIQGMVGVESNDLVDEGLQCVAVLIGVYDKTNGLPIVGVTNQPFYTLDSSTWKGSITWGVCIGDLKLNSLPSSSLSSDQSRSKTILISSSESQSVQDTLSSTYTVRHIAGAGYKLLSVCQSLADSYVLTKSSNYKWDCCGPHAILRSLGGGIVKYTQLHEYANNDYKDVNGLEQIRYNRPDDEHATGANTWCNHGGIVAYRSSDMLENLVKLFKSH